jgi:broad specificity phosphatase PhoE
MTNTTQNTIWIVRHGYREDYANTQWASFNQARPNDSPLNTLGLEQSKETGLRISERIFTQNSGPTNIKIVSSPFFRTIQTAVTIASCLGQCHKDSFTISVEEGLREWINGDVFSEKPKTLSVSDLAEAFKMKEAISTDHLESWIDIDSQSVLQPEYPENAEKFMHRARLVAEKLVEKYFYGSNLSVKHLILVTHASTQMALTRIFSGYKENRTFHCGLCSIVQLEKEVPTNNTNEFEDKSTPQIGCWTLKLEGVTDHLTSGEIDNKTDLPEKYWQSSKYFELISVDFIYS